MILLTSLQKRRDFQRLQQKGVKWVTPSFILQMAENLQNYDQKQSRIGYVVTKKRGSAVVRNRARRRLREAVRLVFPQASLGGRDYVLIARDEVLKQDFGLLQKDLLWALSHVHRLFNQQTHTLEDPENT